MPATDRTGVRYGRLTAIEQAGRTSAGNIKWRCTCDCGNETVTVGTELGRGVQSCGRGMCHPRLGSSGSSSPVWKGDEVGYVGAHARVRRERGSASDWNCENCGAPANHWAYDNKDPDERATDKGVAFSVDPKHYLALCKVCHIALDHGRRTGQTFTITT